MCNSYKTYVTEAWSSTRFGMGTGIFFVRKKNGSQRLIFDTRILNRKFVDPPSTDLPSITLCRRIHSSWNARGRVFLCWFWWSCKRFLHSWGWSTLEGSIAEPRRGHRIFPTNGRKRPFLGSCRKRVKIGERNAKFVPAMMTLHIVMLPCPAQTFSQIINFEKRPLEDYQRWASNWPRTPSESRKTDRTGKKRRFCYSCHPKNKGECKGVLFVLRPGPMQEPQAWATWHRGRDPWRRLANGLRCLYCFFFWAPESAYFGWSIFLHAPVS